ncbi:ABC transporter ATP-binding protein [Bacillus pseudomycoides]|uniref:ABC transporter ATP-binding protein n=2 Tax=Bacillus pseudomycoides TaxID=64104 RepID=UPI000BEE5B96|nr:ABC transporter ATP-binding protein [Bacillus pseudomycoides]PEE35600.1 hypothetical protein COO02_27115 [Bacillus pseudomycoides]PGA90095.1 hypothetical protein COL91_15965 [Bacillus pseudomycoides]
MNWNTNLSLKEILGSFKYWPKIFKLLWKVDKKLIIFIMLLNIMAGTFPALLLLGNQFLINSIAIGWEQGLNIVLISLVVLISIYLFQLLIEQFLNYYEAIYKVKLSYSVNVLLMEKSSTLTLADFENDVIYDQLQRAQREVDYRPYQIFNQILSIINSFVTLVSTATILIVWKWWVVIVLLIVPIFSSISFLKLGRKEFDIEWERAPLNRKLWYLSYLLTKDVTFKEIKLNNLGAHIIKEYSGIYKDFFQIDKSIEKRRLKITFIFDFINLIVVGILIFIILLSTFIKEIMIGTMVSYIQALFATQKASQSLLHQIFSLYESNLYIEQLFSYLEVKENEDSKNPVNKLRDIESIEFKNVSFRYPNSETYVLKNISLTFKKGDVVAIIGKNGSGKSTLVKVLTRLYHDYEGEILINSQPMDSYSIESVREQIGVVFQDFVKYELPVRDNISYGNIGYIKDDEKINNAAMQSGIHEVIESLPNKLDTQLGKWFSEGHQLSGGQWQKIAISRAIIKNASMYILDEPSSALDPEAEKDVFNRFKELVRNRIGIFISHRNSSVQFADKIIVMENGEIKEFGNHEMLIEQNGIYAKLYYMQAEVYSEGSKMLVH